MILNSSWWKMLCWWRITKLFYFSTSWGIFKRLLSLIQLLHGNLKDKSIKHFAKSDNSNTLKLTFIQNGGIRARFEGSYMWIWWLWNWIWWTFTLTIVHWCMRTKGKKIILVLGEGSIDGLDKTSTIPEVKYSINITR